jgi:hypothetical protein
MVTQTLTVALVKSILKVLDRVGPTTTRHRWCRPQCRGRWGARIHRVVPGEPLDLDRLRRAEEDPREGTLSQAPMRTPNTRVRVLHRLSSPSPNHLS